ncbi:hypothetical protein ACQEVX_30220 [Streptomyces syringium]|uniref:hypothetical protein n=1 Tax=Streptomyces syringium TaxID=76729 RepID=UPI003D8DACFC
MSAEIIECQARRRGRSWVVSIPEYGVYGHGQTLKAARENVRQGLELVGVTMELKITPVTPELEKLRSAEDVRTAALSEAVAALRLRWTSLTDIALATGAPIKEVKQLLAERGVLADQDSQPPSP